MSSNTRSLRPSHVLQGPRPTPLTIGKSSVKIAKNINKPRAPPLPVVIYLRSPTIIHVRPEEFMSLVQQLTGNRSNSRTAGCNDEIMRGVQKWKSSSNRKVEGQNKFHGEEVAQVPTKASSLGFDDHDHDYFSGYCLDIQMS